MESERTKIEEIEISDEMVKLMQKVQNIDNIYDELTNVYAVERRTIKAGGASVRTLVCSRTNNQRTILFYANDIIKIFWKKAKSTHPVWKFVPKRLRTNLGDFFHFLPRPNGKIIFKLYQDRSNEMLIGKDGIRVILTRNSSMKSMQIFRERLITNFLRSINVADLFFNLVNENIQMNETDNSDDGGVYVITNKLYRTTNIYKIGSTNNLPLRISQLNTSSAYDYYCVLFYKHNDRYALERHIHEKLEEKRIIREFFRLTLADLEAIGKLCDSYVKEVSTKPSSICSST
jgi:hypothetical protein